MRGVIQRIHIKPALGSRNPAGKITRGERILSQLVIGGNDLAANVLAPHSHPLIKSWGVGQMEISEEVAPIGVKGSLEGGGACG